MRISIVTISFNSAAHINGAITSVLSQGYDDLEYIIVDGGSTDGTIEIIRAHAERDRRIRWQSAPDNGIADAFNKGIAMSTGEIIGMLNSDDRYVPGALSRVAEEFAAHADIDIIHGNMLRVQDGKPVFLLKPADIDRNIWHEMPINHPATFVTRRAYDRTGRFDTGLRIAMDYDMMLRFRIAGLRFRHVDQVLAEMSYGGVSDERVMAGLREVYLVSVRHGYPRWKAGYWFAHKGLLRCCKLALRKLGLYSLMRLHPKFKRC